MYVNNQKTCLANSMPTYRAGMCDYEVKWFYGDFRREYLILPTYSSLHSVAYTQVAYRKWPIDSSLLLSLKIFWPTPSIPEARL